MVSDPDYVPDRGHLVWLEFTPQAGREQAGRRPALILTPKAYNIVTSLAIACPITSKVRGYPFESVLPDDFQIRGAVLSDHVKSIDWRARHAAYAADAPEAVISDVIKKVRLLVS